MNPIVRSEIARGVTFSYVSDNRFKTMRISATALLPLQAETVSAYALLSQVLTRSCAQYPDFTTLSKKLSSLYGAALEAGVRKLGEVLALTFSVSGIDDRYALSGESISEELSKLLCSVLFEPLLRDDAFDAEEVEQERRQLIDTADAELNDKRVYANNRLLELMCDGEPYGVRRYGSRDGIKAVTSSELYNTWKTMLSGATFEIIYVGDSSPEMAKGVFAEKFSSVQRELLPLGTTPVSAPENVRDFSDKMEVSQAKLLLGYRTSVAAPQTEVTAMRLMCAILGGSAHSKFFKNVREKQSLCYYCISRYHRVKGIMTVESGVESENIEKTKNAIMAELDAIRKGDITDDEINFAKLSVSNDFVSICDTVSGIGEWYLSQLGDGRLLSVEEAIADFNSVTKEQIVAVANKLTLDTVYVLKGNEEV
ncbi:MAG: insulinase family protein [Clostridia bacterium]|nr:insulinase family protein [Clostridia bacterium]